MIDSIFVLGLAIAYACGIIDEKIRRSNRERRKEFNALARKLNRKNLALVEGVDLVTQDRVLTEAIEQACRDKGIAV